MFGVCGGTLSSEAVQARGTDRDSAVTGTWDSGGRQRTGGDNGLTAAAGDTRAGELQA